MTTGKTGTTSGRPPRRSKAAKPVTIDLKAEDVKTDAKRDGAPSSKDSSAKPASKTEQSAKSGDMKSTGSASADKTGSGAGKPSAHDRPKSGSGSSADKAAEKQKGGYGGNGFTGGLIGGGIALLAMLGVQYAGLMPSSKSDDAAGAPEIAAVSSELDQLKTTMDQLSSTVAQLPTSGGDAPGLSAIDARIDALETAVETAASPGEGSGEIEDRLAVLSQEIADLKGGLSVDANGNGPNAETIAALQETVAGLESRTSEISEELTQLQSGLGDIGKQVTTLATQQSELEQSLTARIESAEAAANEPGQEMAMARAIAVSGLKTAIDRGGSFASELEAFASVSPDDPAIGELRSLAATGVPTSAWLIDAFPEAANRMIASADKISDDAGLAQRLWSSAQSVVKVRKVGNVEGDSIEAIAARLETQLKNGNLDAAIAEWTKLPEEAKEAAADFGQALGARAQVEKLLAAVQIAQPTAEVETNDAASGDAAPKTAE